MKVVSNTAVSLDGRINTRERRFTLLHLLLCRLLDFRILQSQCYHLLLGHPLGHFLRY